MTVSARRPFRWPLLVSLRGYQRAWLMTDIAAGITLAAVGIPEAMGYTKIAGMPVITGIYTVFLPFLAFALFGGSRSMVVGADSASAAIMFATLSVMLPGQIGSTAYVHDAQLIALMVAVLLVIARLARLGFLANFLSKTALIGFLTGVGVQVALGELPDMAGLKGSGGTLNRVAEVFQHATSLNGIDIALALAVLVLIFGGGRISERIPSALIALALTTIITGVARLGIETVGSVRGGLPPLGPPTVPWSHLGPLIGVSLSIFVVVLAQSAATARSFAAKHDETVDENQDLIGLAAAEIAAGLSGTFPVNGSPTKTAVVDAVGGRTQLANVTSAVLAVAVLLVATGLLVWLPSAALAAVVFTIGVKLIDWRHMTELWRIRKDEFLVAAATALMVIFVGVEQAILLAVALSIIDYTNRGYHPRDVVLVRHTDGTIVPTSAAPGRESEPGVLVYRFDGSLFFANADYFSSRLMALVARTPHPVRALVLDVSPMSDIDYSAGQVLHQVLHELITTRGLTVVLAHSIHLTGLLTTYGIDTLVPSDRRFDSLHAAVAAAESAAGGGQAPST